MKKINIFPILASLILTTSCNQMKEEEVLEIGMKSCKTIAPFIQKLGASAANTAFSSTENNTKGIVLIDVTKNYNDSNRKVFADSSWKKFGYMGAITTDDKGNTYTAAIPFVNTLDLPYEKMNIVYKIDAITGKMEVFCALPKPAKSDGMVPFAILGIYFDCHSKKLYVSSVATSNSEEERGVIFVVDVATAKVIDTLSGYDALGIFVGGNTGIKQLYFGSARTSNIYSVELNKNGRFRTKNCVKEISLDNLGSRGNDKARRIRYDQYGNLVIQGIDFNYNLAAQTNKLETGYKFVYNVDKKIWEFASILQ